MNSIVDLSKKEMKRIIHLYSNGYNDLEWLAKRFELTVEEIKALTKNAKVLTNLQPKYKPGDKIIITVSEKSAPSETGFLYRFDEFPKLSFKKDFVENNLQRIDLVDDNFDNEIDQEEIK